MNIYPLHRARKDIVTADCFDYVICLQGIGGNDEARRYLIDKGVPLRTIERVLFCVEHRRAPCVVRNVLNTRRSSPL